MTKSYLKLGQACIKQMMLYKPITRDYDIDTWYRDIFFSLEFN